MARNNSTEENALTEEERSTFYDAVNHPQHYMKHPSGIECIAVVEHFNFNIGNAIKYLWRAGLKSDKLEDLRKAQWYVGREIERVLKFETEKIFQEPRSYEEPGGGIQLG